MRTHRNTKTECEVCESCDVLCVFAQALTLVWHILSWTACKYTVETHRMYVGALSRQMLSRRRALPLCQFVCRDSNTRLCHANRRSNYLSYSLLKTCFMPHRWVFPQCIVYLLGSHNNMKASVFYSRIHDEKMLFWSSFYDVDVWYHTFNLVNCLNETLYLCTLLLICFCS